MNPEIDKNLSDIWYNPGHPVGFSGFSTFYKYLKNKFNYSEKTVRIWLAKQPTYTLYYPVRKNFTRNKIISWGSNWLWQIDLAHLPDLKYITSNHVWILVCIDSFSKFLWAKPMKTKQGLEVEKNLREIFLENNGSPCYIYSDFGLEFWNIHVKKLLDEFNVYMYGARSITKAAHAEIAIKYLKRKIYKWAHKNKRAGNYLIALKEMVDAKNNTPHTAHSMKPKEVSLNNQQEVFYKLYPNFFKKKLRNKKPIFSPGDMVRISKLRSKFQKGFRQNYSAEIYKIGEILKYRNPPAYKVIDQDGSEILGSFYGNELILVKND